MVDRQSWGNGEDIGSQLLGTYESELRPYFERLIEGSPDILINVGCAEGFYAVGFARRMPTVQVRAYDIDAKAREICHANASLNGVAERVRIGDFCSPETLVADIANAHFPAILADCEGCEADLLLNPLTKDAVSRALVIVEVHQNANGQSPLGDLISTYAPTHRHSIVQSGPRNPHAFPFLDRFSDADKWMLVCENRPRTQYWLIFEPIGG